MERQLRILITGGAGFLGSHLCDFLLAHGHEIICIDNLITGTTTNIAHHLGNDRFVFIEHDVTKFISLDEDVDYILHFASPASPIAYYKYPIQTLEVGSLGTHNVLTLAEGKGARFLLASTSEVYGDPLVNPQGEDYLGNVNPVGPRSVYDESKRFAEALTMAYHRVHGVDTKIARIFNTYGPRMCADDGRAIPTFISQALHGEPLTVFGDGSQTRSFCYVSDLIEGIYRLMLSELNEPVNLGNLQELTIQQLAQEVLELTGSKSKIECRPLPQDDPKLRRPDISRAREHLGWEPEVALRDGLLKTIDWFRRLAQARVEQ